MFTKKLGGKKLVNKLVRFCPSLQKNAPFPKVHQKTRREKTGEQLVRFCPSLQKTHLFQRFTKKPGGKKLVNNWCVFAPVCKKRTFSVLQRIWDSAIFSEEDCNLR
jgi:hypothetical protein